MSVFHVPSVCANANARVVGAAFRTRPLAGEDFERVERELGGCGVGGDRGSPMPSGVPTPTHE